MGEDRSVLHASRDRLLVGCLPGFRSPDVTKLEVELRAAGAYARTTRPALQLVRRQSPRDEDLRGGRKGGRRCPCAHAQVRGEAQQCKDSL